MTNAQTVAALIEANAGADGVFSTILPGVFLLRASQPTEAVHTFYEPSLCYVAQGRKHVSVGSFEFDYEPGAALAVSIGLPARGEVVAASPQEPFLCIRVELRQTVLTDLRGRIQRRNVIGVNPGLGLMQPSHSLEDALLRTLQLLAVPKDVPVIWPLLEREISYHLLAQGTNCISDHLLPSQSRFGAVSRVANYLCGHFKEEIEPLDAARWAGKATEKLSQDFRKITGMSVADYLRSLRLQEGRRLLMIGVEDPSKLAQAVGYQNVALFEKDYAETFHATPDEDARHRRRSQTVVHEE